MEFAEFIKTPMVNDVTLRRPFMKAVTDLTLCVTGHHVILSSRKNNKEELWLLHDSVDSLEKRLAGAGGVINIRCKNFSRLSLEIPSAEGCLNVASSIEQLSNIDDVTLSYPFFHRSTFDILEDGWQAFTLESEWNRYKDCSEDWRLSNANKDYKLCPTYPQAVFVPKSITDDQLVKIAQFRQGGRFPVLSYYHKDSKAVLMRCSQPLSGTSGRRCKDDEKLLNSVLGIERKKGYIIDTRSMSNAKAEQKTGGGYEPEAHYSQWKRINQSIERRQVFHESLIKVIEAAMDTNALMDKWLSKLESSNWLSHVKDILTCSCLVAQCIDKDAACVLVHGSEGVDTTLQVTSLAQVILDHDCRTFTGFEALIEREWLQAGHPFGDRCAKSAHAITKQRQESPVFLLFLDCVWQVIKAVYCRGIEGHHYEIWQQFPCSFEFTEDFLILLFEHAYSSQYGTFLRNCDKERKDSKLNMRTISLWSYINRPEVLGNYINPLYDPNPAVVWPSVAPQSLHLWDSLYLRSQINPAKKREAWMEVSKIKEYDTELRSKVTKLRRQLAGLETEAVNAGVILPSTLEEDLP